MAKEPNGSIHGMSMAVGELKGTVTALKGSVHELKEAIEHLNNNWKTKDTAAALQREHLSEKFEELRSEVLVVRSSVESVQQDVAEMKNDMSITQDKLNQIEQSKTVVMGAVGDVNELKQFRVSLEKKEQRALGWWDILTSIGKIGWTIIAALIIGGFAIILQFVLPRFL